MHHPAALPAALALACAGLAPACAGPAPAQPIVRGQLELYETAPVETELGADDLREAQEVWLETIEEARVSLDLAHFYASVRPGPEPGSRPGPLEPIVAALEDAAARGVRVRFLAEDRFYDTYPETLERLAGTPGITLARIDLAERGGGVLHAKLLIADSGRVCVGSHNFDWRSLEHIQELGCRIDSAEVAGTFGNVFELDWLYATEGGSFGFERLEPAYPVLLRAGELGPVEVTPVFSPESTLPIGVAWDLPHIVGLINSATESLDIALLTYRPVDREGRRFEALAGAIEGAAARGVRVRLMVADWGKRRGTVEELQRIQQIEDLSVRFVTLPQSEQGFVPFARCIHAKYLVADRARAWLGTSNFERSYFESGRNAGLVLVGAGVGARLRTFFDATWDSPYTYDVDPDATYSAPQIGPPEQD